MRPFYQRRNKWNMKYSRKYLSAQGLLSIIRDQFKKIIPFRDLAPRSNQITLTDCCQDLRCLV